jgi:hypothetical protein
MTYSVTVVFHNPEDLVVSPMVYLHRWGPKIFEELEAALPLMPTGNVAYACARFVGYCHDKIEGTQQLGVDNLWEWGGGGESPDKVYHEIIAELGRDADFVLVNVQTWEVMRGGEIIGRLAPERAGSAWVRGGTVEKGECLSLDSSRWSELWHMYREAGDVPSRLQDLEVTATDEELAERLRTLLVGVYHQSDVTTAAYAVVPHLRRLYLACKLATRFRYLGCIAEIEDARRYHEGIGSEDSIVPEDLAPAYFGVIHELPELIAGCYNWLDGTWT